MSVSSSVTSIDFRADLTVHPQFELISQQRIESLSLDVLICRHTQTGAMHYHLAHPSDENAFLLGFRTQPMDSKGEAHILEHVALCGSAKYPVRDPFFSMIKRSLNTFMNAMTAADWTAYPFATQNKNDYFNLLSVYLDAAFFPNIHPLDFAQEGIRIELDDSDKPQFKGIVFNEMKGAMSGEIDQLYHAVAHHLFPTSTYHYNSGGDPACIPDLSHEELLSFHHSHYHPSNSVIMSFGNIPVAQTQAKLHEDALAQFSMGKKHASVAEQRYTEPVQAVASYSVDADAEAQTHHVLAWLLPSITDPNLRLALRLLEGVLLEHAGSPLRAYLDSHPLATAPSPLLGLDDSHYEMAFYAGIRGSEPEHADAFEQGILALLTDIASQPISEESIETILHQIELDQRHIGGDGMPYGLNLMFEGFSTAVHDGNPMDVWQVDAHLAWLREQVTDPMWLPNLIKTYLLDNPHRVRVSLLPDSHKAAQLAEAEQAQLDVIANELDAAGKQALRQQAAQLAQRQAQVDDLSVLPKVGLEDVPAEVNFKQGSIQSLDIQGNPSTLYQYHAGTNGLYYYQLLIPLCSPDNDGEDQGGAHDAIINHPLLPLYLGLLSELGTDSLSAREFQALQASHSSGVTARISQRTAIDNCTEVSSYFVLATRALTRKPEAIDLVKQVLNHSVFTETDRIKELLQQKQASWQARLSGAGHAYAMQTASRGMSRQAALEYAHSGLPALNSLKAFLAAAKADADQWQQLAMALQALHQRLITLPKQVLLVCEPEQSERLTDVIVNNWQACAEDAGSQAVADGGTGSSAEFASGIPAAFMALSSELELLNQHLLDEPLATSTASSASASASASGDRAWLVATNVYHNASAYRATPANHADTASLMVLATYLRNGYLHPAIREQGGAYGGGAVYDANACAFKFFSYRDPHCNETFAHFVASVDWLLTEPQSDSQLEEAILGILSGMDKPGSPAGEAVKACFANLHGRGKDWQQQMRGQILAVTIDDLKRVARSYLKDQPHSRACLAPLSKREQLQALGFKVQQLAG